METKISVSIFTWPCNPAYIWAVFIREPVSSHWQESRSQEFLKKKWLCSRSGELNFHFLFSIYNKSLLNFQDFEENLSFSSRVMIFCSLFLFLFLWEIQQPEYPLPLLCCIAAQKPSNGNISGTKSGIIDPLMSKRLEKIMKNIRKEFRKKLRKTF